MIVMAGRLVRTMASVWNVATVNMIPVTATVPAMVVAMVTRDEEQQAANIAASTDTHILDAKGLLLAQTPTVTGLGFARYAEAVGTNTKP
jgi:hypothetical protein